MPKSDKLLKLSVDAGDPAPRQILAGIAQHYAPEAAGRQARGDRGQSQAAQADGPESQGMVLAASDETGLFVSTVSGDAKPGSIVK